MNVSRLSFVIPCHNSGPYLREAVDSILAQRGDFVLDEILVVDDYSTDQSTLNVLHALQQETAVRVIRHSSQRGPGAARNTGVHAARSEWVCFLDADDVLASSGLQARVAALEHFPDAEWIGGDFIIWRADGSLEDAPFFASRPITQRLLEPALSTRTACRLPQPINQFVEACLARTCSSMIKRQRIIDAGLFDTSLPWVEDYEFFLRLATACDFVFMPQTTFYYRQHSASTTNAPARWAPAHWHITAFANLLSNPAFAEHRPLIKRRMAGFHLENYYFYRENGARLKAAEQAFKAAYLEPRHFGGWRALASVTLKP